MPFKRRPGLHREHSLHLHHDGGSAERRMAAMIAEALQRGDKVIHTHAGTSEEGRDRLDLWLPPGIEPGDQLELVPAPDERKRTDGRHAALLASLTRRIESARQAGFTGVTCTSEDDALLELTAGAADLLDYERGLHRLAEDPDTVVLCCYRLDRLLEEGDGVAGTLAGIHFARLDDALWSVRMHGGILSFGGELDDTNVDRVREVLLSALSHDIHVVDLRSVTHLSAGAMRAFETAAEQAASEGTELHLVRVPPIVDRTLTIAGLHDRPGIAVQDGEAGPNGAAGRVQSGPTETRRVAEMFGELTRLEEAASESDVTNGLARILAEVIAPAAAVSVTIGPPASPRLLDSNSQLAQQLDGLQMQADEGPCQSAWEERQMVLTPDVRADDRWPEFTRLAAPTELVSALALPVWAGDEIVGVINAYSTDTDAFGRIDIALAELAAFAVGQVFQRLESTRHLSEMVANLRQALTSRSVIDQAKGILMARHSYDAESAFDALSQLSQRENVKVRDLAAFLVEDVQED